jgi:hypothetical protein
MLIALEIQEGKAAQAAKPHAAEHGDGTAVTLRLLLAWCNTWRVVIGDSAFSSVKTLVQLWLRRLYFMGIVNSAHRMYPTQWMTDWHNECEAAEPCIPRGNTRVATTSMVVTNGAVDVTIATLAVGWRDKTVK